MVILGNPPYSGHSANKGKWISDLLRGIDSSAPGRGTGVPPVNTHGQDAHATKTANYFDVDGKPLGERNPKVLQDDYVKFIRFAQWRIERTGYGVLGLISNHGYLDNPTFRGMRQSLLDSFHHAYVCDLHGNVKKKEVCPDGSKDENVFDIQQGVAIGIFVKKPVPTRSRPQLGHAQCYGLRKTKYAWLSAHCIGSTKWERVQPVSPFYFLMARDTRLLEEYNRGRRLPEIMPARSSAMNTARDSLVIDVAQDELRERIGRLRAASGSSAELAQTFHFTLTRWWDFEAALRSLKSDPNWQDKITPCLYRPFDRRWLYYAGDFIDRPRAEINCHMLKPNLSLVTTRQTKETFSALASNLICGQHKIAAVYDRSYFYPLYLYAEPHERDLLNAAEGAVPAVPRRPNLNPEFVAEVEKRLGWRFIPDGKGDLKNTFGPEDIFDYMYALFHSPTYRTRYAEFLKIDFPRLPLTSSRPLFRALCKLGGELVPLHLMDKHAPVKTQYPVEADNRVEKVRYTEPGQGTPTGRVWINNDQYFENVPPEIWQFHIGGYQVCQKWLKDRKGRVLTYDDLTHYQHIISALGETIRLMSRIDQVIAAHGGWPIA